MGSTIQRLLLGCAFLAACGLAHSRQICLPSHDAYVPENYQTQSTGYYSYVAQRGLLDQMGSTPDEAEGYSFPFEKTTTGNGGTTTVKKWLTSVGPYRGQEWKYLLYDTTYYFIHTQVTTCNSAGCAEDYTFGSFKPVGGGSLEAHETIICITPVETPILIQLQGSRHRVPEPEKDPRVDFTLKATIGEYTYPSNT